MKFAFTDEQRDLRSVLSAFLDKRAPLEDVLRLLDSDARFSQTGWQALADELGVMGVDTPAALGGIGLGAVELAIVSEELGCVAYTGPFLASIGMAVGVLQHAVTAGCEPARELLARAIAGEVMTVIWPHAGQDASKPRQADAVRAVEQDGNWTLFGSATGVLHASSATTVLVFADSPAGEVLLAVPAERGALIELPTIDPTRPLCDVRFEHVAADLLLTDCQDVRDQALQRASLVVAAEASGGARRCLQMASEYARDRIQFGKPIGSFQGVKHRLADLLVEHELATSATFAAAAHLASGDRAAAALSVPIAVLSATETYCRAAGDNVQIHGGIGFTWEHPAHLHVKRAQVDRFLMGGPADQLRKIYTGAGPTLG